MKLLRVVLPSFVLVLVSATAMALPPGGRLLLQTPEERAQDWQASFLKFVAEHPELSREKVLALEDVATIEDLSFFLNSPRKDRLDTLAERVAQLGRVLSAFEYQQFLASAPKELVDWMKSNEVIGEDGGTANCNCGDSQDCSGGTCRNVTCVHEGGTSHSGRC